jgi:hypothetical protein
MLSPNSYDTEGGETEKRKGDERGQGRDGIPRKKYQFDFLLALKNRLVTLHSSLFRLTKRRTVVRAV